MTEGPLVTRRRLLLGAASVVAIGAAGRIATMDSSTSPEGDPQPPCEPQREIVFGSSAATWQLSDADYRRLFVREAEMLFTEDDLLWYRLRPKPDSVLDFTYADQIIEFAEQHGMLVFAAHLVWDEGFGEGWTDDDLWGMDEQTARKVLFDTVERTVKRYRGRVAAWSVVNEAIGTEGVRGLRTDVPGTRPSGPLTWPSPSTSPTLRIRMRFWFSTSSDTRPSTNTGTGQTTNNARRCGSSIGCSTTMCRSTLSACRRICRRMSSPKGSTPSPTEDSCPRSRVAA